MEVDQVKNFYGMIDNVCEMVVDYFISRFPQQNVKMTYSSATSRMHPERLLVSWMKFEENSKRFIDFQGKSFSRLTRGINAPKFVFFPLISITFTNFESIWRRKRGFGCRNINDHQTQRISVHLSVWQGILSGMSAAVYKHRLSF